jgi:hypothetical protein
MRQSVRRWLAGAGAVAAVGAAVGGQAATASAATSAAAGRAAPAHAAVAHARAAHAGADPAYQPSGHVIHYGAKGPAVRALQRRLAVLHYYPGKVDGQFGQNTLEAVWAFKEVQRLGTKFHPNDVGVGFQRRLVHPRMPRVLKPHGGAQRIEVNQNIEVLVLYNHNKPELISHVSTGGRYYFCEPHGGCGHFAVTPDGDYYAHWFAKGWLTVPLGQMYNPVFFIGGAYAIHGDIPVPLAAVSHGCVRIPMDISQFFHKMIHISQTQSKATPIYIRGRT